MNRTLKISIIIIMILSLVIGFAFCSPKGDPTDDGGDAGDAGDAGDGGDAGATPGSLDFTSTNHDGTEFTLSSLKDSYEYVLVDFSADSCSGCMYEAKILTETVEKVQQAGHTFESVTVLVGAKDVVALHTWSTKYNNLEYVVGVGNGLEIQKAYEDACGGNEGLPYNVLLKRDPNKGYECIKAGFHKDINDGADKFSKMIIDYITG